MFFFCLPTDLLNSTNERKVWVLLKGHNLLLCTGSLSAHFGEEKSPIRVSEQVWGTGQQECPRASQSGKWSTKLFHLGCLIRSFYLLRGRTLWELAESLNPQIFHHDGVANVLPHPCCISDNTYRHTCMGTGTDTQTQHTYKHTTYTNTHIYTTHTHTQIHTHDIHRHTHTDTTHTFHKSLGFLTQHYQ